MSFSAGLLHDVGQLVLARAIPNDYADTVAEAQKLGRPLHELELERLGVTHATAGAYLLSLWGLPNVLIEAVAWHHEPEKAEGNQLGPAGAIHVAQVLLDDASAVREDLDREYLEAVGALARLPRFDEIASQLRLGSELPDPGSSHP